MSLTLQVLATGLAAGGVYGLFAIGHSLIYRLTGVVNFAFGDLAGLGVFITLLIAAGTGPIVRGTTSTPRFLFALTLGLLVCVLLGAATYTFAVQPFLERGWTLGWIAATGALALAIHAAVDASFGRPSYVLPDPIPFDRLGQDGFVELGGASVRVHAFFVLAFACLLAAIASWALYHTKRGRGLQAIASDLEGARVVGIPVERLLALAFGVTGGLAALAALAAAPDAPFDTGTGTLLGLKGLVAALLVRFGSPARAFAAGLGLGVVEAMIGGLSVGGISLGPSYRELLPLGLALLLLTVWPMQEALEDIE